MGIRSDKTSADMQLDQADRMHLGVVIIHAIPHDQLKARPPLACKGMPVTQFWGSGANWELPANRQQ